MAAFLDTIAYSEGTDDGIQRTNDDGYDVLVMGGLFFDYKDHPRQKIAIPKYGIVSTAAGRYQLLAKWYDAYKKQLNLPDFSPLSQDAISVQQIRERGALPDIAAGRLAIALKKCSNIWASLPGAAYGQYEHKFETLKAQYLLNGGTITG